tara:strand:+ start:4329 stop:5117 length:789 start_codon:yes stop_codon:yes gene_type:complete
MKDDFEALKDMVYSGRGITVGMTPLGNQFIGYSLTGRSPSSQARELVQAEKTGTVRTSVTDRETLEKGSPALLIYPAIVPVRGALIASNGAQTDLIYSQVMNVPRFQHPNLLLSHTFGNSSFRYDHQNDRRIDITTYEPDEPNNTPRISACLFEDWAALHIVRCEDGEKDTDITGFKLLPGEGKLITTYKGGNETPLLPFEGQPLEVKVNSETAGGIAEGIYSAIYGGQNQGDNYRVSAAVMLQKKAGDLETAIINRSERGE